MLSILLAAFLTVASPAPITSNSINWVHAADSALASLDIAQESVQLNTDTLSLQFTLRTTFTDPVTLATGQKVKILIEPTLVLCRENVMINMGTVVFDAAGKKIESTTRASVYPNPNSKEQPLTQLIEFVCGARDRDSTPQRSRNNKGLVT